MSRYKSGAPRRRPFIYNPGPVPSESVAAFRCGLSIVQREPVPVVSGDGNMDFTNNAVFFYNSRHG